MQNKCAQYIIINEYVCISSVDPGTEHTLSRLRNDLFGYGPRDNILTSSANVSVNAARRAL